MGYKSKSPIPVTEGGTNATSLTTTDGVIYYDGSKLATTSAGSSGQVLQSAGAGVAPGYSTATYPATTTVSQLLYSSSANVVGGLATANNGTLVTSATGVPSVLAGPGTTGNILQSNAAAAPSYSTATYPSTAGTSGKVLVSDGTNIVSSTPTFPNSSATSGKFIRSDGTNWIASTPTLPTSAGTAGKLLRSDGTNYVESTATYPATATGTGTILRADGTNWAATTATYPNNATAFGLSVATGTDVYGQLSVGSTGTVLTGVTGAVPAFSATPTVTSISFGGSALANYVTAGTWTPTFIGSSTAGTTTYSTQDGRYSRIGNIVTIMCKIVISAATGTGSVRIQGIPFNPLIPATAPLYFDGSGFTWPTGRTSICAFLNTDGNTSLQVSGSLTAISGLAMANAAAELYFTCTYLI